ncbi:Hsp20/alpha crystallin family protein [Abyssalbus ytuae]|uniref:Hsp20/alpha crystallin family protein n=1 Tax=Abyssalbus ytuae TaxID=2926907 RepID=A0A9E6ZML3_9FLAO|nr:Hsp20/alpha crystallin family protein [Abyssalbus ytuae]UOB17090.1 Hsp20/alpha crystallin family protein [Abyssalbus ytuae]
MSLIKFNKRLPWFNTDISDFFDTEDFFRDSFWTKSMVEQPALNIRETDKEFHIELAAPGLSKNDFEVTIDDGYLNIYGKKSDKKEEKDKNYTRREFNYSSFKRSLLLPENVKEEDISAHYENGILMLTLFKKEETKVHKPKVVHIG